ncbi:hypothetical protein [Caedibacter taeniospiralis]|jgi:hypothetical protein|uniref:hypothetical protein n=1 Tax=Caedibacter taeniospiralis TaxID=28907 RepID=UPI0037BF8BC6
MVVLQEIKQVSQQFVQQRQQFEFKKPLLYFLNQLQQEQGKLKSLEDKLGAFLLLLRQYLKASAHAHRYKEVLNEETQKDLDRKLEEIESFYHQLSVAYEVKQEIFEAQLKQEQDNHAQVKKWDSEVAENASKVEIPEDSQMTNEQITTFVQSLDSSCPCVLCFELTEYALQNAVAIVREMLNGDWLEENIGLNLCCKSRNETLNKNCREYMRELSDLLLREDLQQDVFIFHDNHELAQEREQISSTKGC